MGTGARPERSLNLVHVDTDFGGDPDGGRARCARYVLGVSGRDDVAVAAGAQESMTTGTRFAPTLGDPRYWPAGVTARGSAPGAASDALAASIERGATVVAIGALPISRGSSWSTRGSWWVSTSW